MTILERRRAADLIRSIVAVLRTIPVDAGEGKTASARALDAVFADPETVLTTGALGDDLQAALDGMLAGNATLPSLLRATEQVAAIEATTPDTVELIGDCAALVLAAAAERIATTTFDTREDLIVERDRLVRQLDLSAIGASNAGLRDLVVAVRALLSATVSALDDTIHTLPRRRTYRLGAALPSLVLSTRFYGDGGSADDLVALNRVSNPLFMPIEGVFTAQ
ncbi:MAG: hypothetical protein AAGL24_10065 [Pseudomonadota bacterium]